VVFFLNFFSHFFNQDMGGGGGGAQISVNWNNFAIFWEQK
jgi:hypothetical protein